MILLRMLNNCTIETPRKQIAPHASTIFALALYLIIERGKRIPRSAVAELFWPNSSSTASRSSLRRAVWKLRELGFPLKGFGDQSILLPKNFASTDIDSLTTEPDFILATSSFDILPWFAPKLSPQFSDWVDDVRFIYSNRIILHIEGAITRAKARGDWRLVGQLCEQALLLNPESLSAKSNLKQAQQIVNTKETSIRLNPRLLSHRPTQVAEATAPYSNSLSISAPIIGRINELTTLQHALANAKLSCGSYIHISGGRGIGKSKLAREFAAIANVDNAVVAVLTLSKDSPPNSIQLIESVCSALLDAPGAAGASPLASANLRQLSAAATVNIATSELKDNILDLLDAVSEEQPVVIIVENTEYLSVGAKNLLVEIGRWVAEHPTILITASENYSDSLGAAIQGSKTGAISISLNRLTHAESIQHAENFMKLLGKPVKSKIANWAATISGGMPLKIEEAIKHWSVTGNTDSLPPAIEKLLIDRLNQQTPICQRLIQFVVLLGHNATHERVRKLINCTFQEQIDSIETLCSQKILCGAEKTGSNIQILRCATQAVELAALSAIPKATELVLHAQIAEGLAAEAATSPSQSLFRDIAQHFHKCGNSTQAIKAANRWIKAQISAGDIEGCELACSTTLTLCADNNDRIPVLTTYINCLSLQGKAEKCQSVVNTANTALKSGTRLSVDTSILKLAVTESQYIYCTDLEKFQQELIEEWKKPEISASNRQILSIYILRVANRLLQESTGIHGTLGIDSKGGLRIDTSTQIQIVSNTTSAAEKLTKTSTSDLLRKTAYNMYLYDTAGEMDLSRSAAKSILALTEKISTSLSAVIYSSLACEVLLKQGFLNDAEDGLIRLFGVAVSYDLVALQYYTASNLVDTYMQQGALDSAFEWNKRANLLGDILVGKNTRSNKDLPENKESDHDIAEGTGTEIHTGKGRWNTNFTTRARIANLKLQIALQDVEGAKKTSELFNKIKPCRNDSIATLELDACRLRINILDHTISQIDVESGLKNLAYRCDILPPLRQLQYVHFTLFLAQQFLGNTKNGISELADFAQPFYLSEAYPSKEITEVFTNKNRFNLREDEKVYTSSSGSTESLAVESLSPPNELSSSSGIS